MHEGHPWGVAFCYIEGVFGTENLAVSTRSPLTPCVVSLRSTIGQRWAQVKRTSRKPCRSWIKEH